MAIINRFYRIFIFSTFIVTYLNPPTYAFTFPFPPVLPGESQEIQVIGSTVRIKGLTNQDNELTLNGRAVPVQKDGSFQEDIIIPLGETQIDIMVKDPEGNIKTYRKEIKAKENHFFLVGIADGTLNFVNAASGVNWERDTKHFKDGIHLDGKISYYLAGKIKGRFLIKSALDTDKSTQEKLFTNIDPDKYYPIYGDNSTVVYDVNSQGKLYVLLEWDKSGLTFGNYQTMIEDLDMKLATYKRTLYGGKLHLETKSRTIYGEPVGKATAFIAEANQHAGQSSFLGTGASLYYLRHRNIVEGSENIKIEVRDKNSGMVIFTVPQDENIDYEIKYDEGRILFKKPVLSVTSSNTIISQSILDGNPVYIVTNYEYKSQDAFPISPEDLDHKTGGFRLSQAIGDNIRIGATYVQEMKDKDQKDYKLYGADTVLKIGNFTKVQAEFAESTAKTIPLYVSYNGGYDFIKVDSAENTQDKAIRIGFNTAVGEFLGLGREFFDVSGYYQYIGDDFISSDTLFESGTEKYGIQLAHKLTENDRVKFLYERKELNKDSSNQASKNELTSKKIQIFTGQWTHVLDKLTFITEYMFKDRHTAYNYTDLGQEEVREHFIGERIQYDVSKDTSLFLGGQVKFTGFTPEDYRGSAGFTKVVSNDTVLSAEASIGNVGNSILASLQRNINEDSSVYVTHSFSDSAIDGKNSITSFGTNTTINKKAKIRTERQFITNDQRGIYAANLLAFDYQVSPEASFDISYQRRAEDMDYALTGSTPQDTVSANLSCIFPDRLKFYSKSEYRKDQDKTWQILTDNQAELKLFQDLFLFGEYEYSIAYREHGHDSYSKIDKKQAGIAYRPVDFDWFNLLFKYIRFTDERPDDVTSADGGFLKMHSTSDVWVGECALDLPWNIQIVEKFSYKNEKSLSYAPLGVVKTPENLKAILLVNRLNYHLTKKLDASCEYRFLKQKGTLVKHWEDGFLFEVSYSILKNIAVGAGFNFTSFTDDLLDTDKNAKGFFLRLQGRY